MLRMKSETTTPRVVRSRSSLITRPRRSLMLSGLTVSKSVPQYRHRRAIALIFSPQAGHFLVSPQAESGRLGGRGLLDLGRSSRIHNRASADVGPALAVMHLVAELAGDDRLVGPDGRLADGAGRAQGPRVGQRGGHDRPGDWHGQLGLAPRTSNRYPGVRLGDANPDPAMTRDDRGHGLSTLPILPSSVL